MGRTPPPPPSRLGSLSIRAGLTPDELRAYLRTAIADRLIALARADYARAHGQPVEDEHEHGRNGTPVA
jgi:hypothetical protein